MEQNDPRPLNENPELKAKVSRNLLYLGILGIVMFFSGLTSAYLVTMADNFWVNIDLPQAFYISTAVILLSSVTIHLAYKAALNDNWKGVKLLATLTVILGITFGFTQFMGYGELVERGHHLTGNPILDPSGDLLIKGEYGKDFTISFKGGVLSYQDGKFYNPDGREISSSQYMALSTAQNNASSYMYLLTFAHIVHVLGGLLYLLVLWVRVMRNRMGWQTTNKVKLISIYWHFVDLLWIYLFLFLYLIH